MVDTNENTWLQIGQDLYDSQFGQTGWAVEITSDGTRIAVTHVLADSPDENGNNLNDNGTVNVYDLSGSGTNASWVQVGGDLNGSKNNASFGHSVAFSNNGNRLVISEPNFDSNSINNCGRAMVFDLSGSGTNASWVQVGGDIIGNNEGDHTGTSLAISGIGNRILIGSHTANGINTQYGFPYPIDNSGLVRVFDLSGSGTNASWVQVGADIYGENAGDNFGLSTDMSYDGNTIIAGAGSHGTNKQGQARIFEWNGIAWTQLGEKIEGLNEDELLGRCVRIVPDGNRIAVSKPHANSEAGAVQIYDLSGSGTNASWVQVGGDINGENSEKLGWNTSMNSSGTRIVIGSPNFESTDELGNNITYAGKVQVYDLSGSGTNASWVQFGEDIIGESSFANTGYSLAMSADGTRFIFGAHTAHSTDENGTENQFTGHARVLGYENSEEEETTQQSGDICFPAGTPVQTDQGEIAIEKLTSENTIDGVNVVAVVHVYNECDYLVKINKHALGPNYPKKTTLVSRNHRVFVDKKGSDKSVPALALYNGKTITVVQREEHETIYNVLLPTYSKMTINGLVVETLHPKSIYARK